jgi:23S rRNA (adenine2503-C2)-methyltransferase
MQDIKNFTLTELEGVLKEWGERPYHAKQIFSWIYQRGAGSFDAMSDLSLVLRNRLKEDFCLSSLKLSKNFKSLDGTEKFLFELKDGNLLEAVNIPETDRITGCISTQAGCRFACRFCASGLRGFKRSLTAAEMAGEVMYLCNSSGAARLTHVVFMGTGEPLDNYENVLKAIRIINSAEGLGIGARRITISTCGIIPGIKRLAQEGLQIELSISLHAADDKTRASLMPINKKYPLKELIKACGEYIHKTGRQITFEYILIKGLNSGLQNAQKLSTILRGLRLSKVNLIPANPVKELKIGPPEKLEALLFKDYLLKQGLNVTLRRPRGKDIEAACGQLRLRYEKK